MKLTIAQSTLLRIIATAPDGLWYPRDFPVVEGKYLSLDGSAIAQTSKALWRKGLAIHNEKLGPYASWITDEGRKVAEQEKGKPLTWISVTHQHLEDRKKWVMNKSERQTALKELALAGVFSDTKYVKCDTCDNREELGGEITERTLEDDGWELGPTETRCPDCAEVDVDEVE